MTVAGEFRLRLILAAQTADRAQVADTTGWKPGGGRAPVAWRLE